MVEYLEGILKISNILLSAIAGLIALSLINSSKIKQLRPWRLLIAALIFFAFQEFLGALRAFNIYTSQFLTHIVPTIILALLIIALIMQININKGYVK